MTSRARPVEQPVDVKRTILSGHDLLPHEEIVAAFLETSLLVQQPQLPEEGGKREEKPDWLKASDYPHIAMQQDKQLI